MEPTVRRFAADARPPPDAGTRQQEVVPHPMGTEPEAHEMVKEAVQGILAQNEAARRAFRSMRERGLDEEEAREEIARVLLAVTFHVGQESRRLEAAGGAAELREEAFRRLARGETAEDVFEE